MVRALLILATLLVAACDGTVQCDVSCGEGGSTVVRTFPSCSALRDEIQRRTSGGTISECEADALQACEDELCANALL